ncbi:O-antigen ligase family protein [Flexivirga caeni]|uniref:O-antigen ligase domain-containing protein n=1 Tax=Flexivirga caeni TaxID=2294115 RepID=A0A3M9M9E1_9MICO|nr:O-antigen ligase family protein [Flexivirga caeni]RNI21178.1 O-antigen ligase domain-containing protein [Flexivirga caeni]
MASTAETDVAPARHSTLPASSVLSAYFAFLMVLPARLIIGSLGSMGAPATLLSTVLFAWWVWDQAHRSRRAAGTWLRRITLAFLLVMLLVYAHAMTLPLPGPEISPADSGMLKILAMCGLILTACDGIDSVSDWRRLLERMALGGSLVGILGLLQFATGQLLVDKISVPGLSVSSAAQAITRGAFLRPSGTSTHPIEYGAVIGMLIPLSANLAITATKRKTWRWIQLTVMVCVVGVTLSRTALICGALSLLIVVPSWPRTARRNAAIGGIILIAIGWVAVPGLVGTVRGLFTDLSGNTSVESRTNSYGVAFRFIGHHVLLGRGYGTFLPQYWILDNLYLTFAIETGLVGLAALLCLLYCGARSAYRASRMFADQEDAMLAKALVASVVSGGLSLAFFDGFSFPQSAGCLYLAIGLSGAAVRLAARSSAPRLADGWHGSRGESGS